MWVRVRSRLKRGLLPSSNVTSTGWGGSVPGQQVIRNGIMDKTVGRSGVDRICVRLIKGRTEDVKKWVTCRRRSWGNPDRPSSLHELRPSKEVSGHSCAWESIFTRILCYSSTRLWLSPLGSLFRTPSKGIHESTLRCKSTPHRRHDKHFCP